MANSICLITHRGLDPDLSDFPAESTFEAYLNHLRRGYGLEFDFNLTSDNRTIVFHDATLERITKGVNKSAFANTTSPELKALRLDTGDRLVFLDELLLMINDHPAPLNALHLKSKFQDKASLDILLSCLKNQESVLKHLIVFDTRIETARFLKKNLPDINLAPSIAHPYDIKRYNESVGGTLISLEDAIENKELFSWSWLDEWDLADEGEEQKKFYTQKTFSTLKKAKLKIALVTPELHGTSPGLLGGEAHPDASENRLFNRIAEIISLEPDAVCTDHPDKVRAMINQ